MKNLPSTNGSAATNGSATSAPVRRPTISEALGALGALLDEKVGDDPVRTSSSAGGQPVVHDSDRSNEIPSAVAAEIHALREQVTNQARFQRLAMAGQGLFWLIVLVISHWSEIKPWCDEAWGRSVNGWGIAEFVATEDQLSQHKTNVERLEKDLKRAQAELEKQPSKRDSQEEVAELLISLRSERSKLAEAEGKLHGWRERYKSKKK